MNRDTPLMHQTKPPVADFNAPSGLIEPLPVMLQRMKLKPGEYLLVAVDPRSWGACEDIDRLFRDVMGEDYKRVLIYQKGQLDLTVANLRGEDQ